MEIKKEQKEELFYIRIFGDVDASSSIHLNEALDEASASEGINKILVDCEGLEYISSAGLGVFMSYVEDFEEKEIAFVLYNLKDNVRKVFDLLGLDRLLEIRATEEEALGE